MTHGELTSAPMLVWHDLGVFSVTLAPDRGLHICDWRPDPDTGWICDSELVTAEGQDHVAETYVQAQCERFNEGARHG